VISQSETDLLDILVKSHQLNLPEKVKWRGKEVSLSSKEQLAAGRTIWFIIKRGYGISTATTRASGSFGVTPAKIERAVREAFPPNYFINFSKAKNSNFVKNNS